MSDTAVNRAELLTQPRRKKIGKVTFLISSYGNESGSETAQQLILHMLADQIAYEGLDINQDMETADHHPTSF